MRSRRWKRRARRRGLGVEEEEQRWKRRTRRRGLRNYIRRENLCLNKTDQLINESLNFW